MIYSREEEAHATQTRTRARFNSGGAGQDRICIDKELLYMADRRKVLVSRGALRLGFSYFTTHAFANRSIELAQ